MQLKLQLSGGIMASFLGGVSGWTLLSWGLVVCLGGLAFGTTRGQQGGWTDPTAYAAIALGLAAIVASHHAGSKRVPGSPWIFSASVPSADSGT